MTGHVTPEQLLTKCQSETELGHEAHIEHGHRTRDYLLVDGEIEAWSEKASGPCGAATCDKPAQREHSPCCSSTFHGESLCCQHYCRSHFVEVNQCSPESHAAVAA